MLQTLSRHSAVSAGSGSCDSAASSSSRARIWSAEIGAFMSAL